MEVQAPAGSLATGSARRGRLLRYLSHARTALCFAAAAYILACAATWAWQRHLIFEPEQAMHATPADFKFPVVDVALPVVDKLQPVHTIHGWWIPAANAAGPAAKTVLYLHGNDGNVSTEIDETAPLRELGYSVLLVDYRGYGRSEGGFPSEQGVYADAEASWNYLVHKRGIGNKSLFIYGHSLGGAIAIELARHHPEAAGLIVESSFTSIYDMAMRDWQYALMPVDLLLNQRFDSIAKVGQLSLPVLYIHGTADETVPFEMGLQLYRNSGGAKRFVAIDGGRHEDNAIVGGQAFRRAISTFVEENARPYPAPVLAAK